ncbi:pilus assembly FimT family protein [Prochlorococcus marinus]|uniref:Uncharacterized protein n=1 Tax=Prochlorococcus marinus (strain MIT 9211) TaxID=93059 RepID=A9BA96_PROM4|nr:prepilin-type N-terminal cleavage/methylation domain-containing protein [Prochlorococcus marinus]ABX08758.1 Hypothetical protein P9211_08271 [Prochlorococcus marinus str. MIT 9211]
MNLLHEYLKNPRVRKVLSSKPGNKGFSLVELVVVIAVLAILSAVAIPNFISVQSKAQISAVKNGLVNGIKECVVAYLDDPENIPEFAEINAFNGDYTGYAIEPLAEDQEGCFEAEGIHAAGVLPTFAITYDQATGEIVKECDGADEEGANEYLTCIEPQGEGNNQWTW